MQGFSPIIATSSLKHADYLKSIGATHVLDRSLPSADVLAELPTLTAGQPVVYAFDAISAPDTQHLAYGARCGGRDGHNTPVLRCNPRGQGAAQRRVEEGRTPV